ncbi:sulfate ABC transporter permease [Vibrio splendidus]|uniref:Sulfate ABC transporter permease n=1 Tax=Vibrio lentus TaxID=136468 RepID=A0A4U2F6Z7_9VIBR|nr:porin [Vibrio lentus]PHN84990.1 sulfate ABC transporter permease [Vibrio splendidus]MCC4785773.1 sulfate ABC transporter permease [Vibrio lentus]MCC4818601.1 sulfate ABC transporter permease [Vibrio lentus]PMG68674.1 sulfate ABC transporter permease [Vibrio lentus]PMJ04111.1 sulfate ABC transporter permease [Vibrio lentus]
MKKIITSVLCASIASPAFAIIELTDNFSLSGFGSTSWATSDNDNPLIINRGFTDENCYDCDTTFGVQLDYFYNSFKASVQVVKPPQYDWSDPQLEWAYVGYEFNDFDVSIGRLRLPLFLASEYYYVGQAYMTARPPTEVYNSVLGITAFNGIKVSWTHDVSDEATLLLSPFFGIKDNNEVDFNSTTELEFETNRMFGANLQLSGEDYRWNLSFLDSNFDQTVKIKNVGSLPKQDNQHIQLWSLGAEYEFGQAILASEGQTSDFSSSMYASLGYRLNSFTPYVVYGAEFDSHEHLTGNSYLIGVDYDVLPNVSINGEVQYFEARKANGAFVEDFNALTGFDDKDAVLYTIMLSFVF